MTSIVNMKYKLTLLKVYIIGIVSQFDHLHYIYTLTSVGVAVSIPSRLLSKKIELILVTKSILSANQLVRKSTCCSDYLFNVTILKHK